MKTIWLVIIGLVLLGTITAQRLSTKALQAEVRELGARLDGVEPASPATDSGPAKVVSLGTIPQRVTQLEQSVEQLSKTADLLVERGIAPPTAGHLESMQARLADMAAADRERLQALRLLRRNGQLNDQALTAALGWLEGSTNARTKRDILEQLDGLTNAALRGPLMAMLGKETAGNVREELVDVLADFAHEPDVEKKMWELALNDPDEDVREQAEEALGDARLTPERLDALSKRALNPELSIDERLLALRSMGDGDQHPPEAIAQLSNLAQTSPDPLIRAKLFEAFDGMRNPALMSPLVHGLQDPSPQVRESAADALSAFAADPRIQDWLKHTIQNDADPRVRREAQQALAESQRRRN